MNGFERKKNAQDNHETHDFSTVCGGIGYECQRGNMKVRV